MDLNECDTQEKQVNRELLANWLSKYVNGKSKVGILPGPKALEITHLWDKIGVLRRNIYAYTNNDEEFDRFQSIRGVNAICADLFQQEQFYTRTILALKSSNIKLKFKKGCACRVFKAMYFDFYANYQAVKLNGLINACKVLLCNGGILGFTLYGARENDKHYKKIQEIMSDQSNNYVRFANLRAAMLFVMEGEYRTTDFYPSDIITTRYVANRVPMYTVLIKFNRFKQSSMKRRKEFADQKGQELVLKPIYNIDSGSNKYTAISPVVYSQPVKKNKVYKKRKFNKSEVVYLLNNKIPDSEIKETYNVSTQQLAAYKAHITMGTYAQA